MSAAGEPPAPRSRSEVVAADVRSPADSPDVEVAVDRWQHLALAALETEGATGSLGLTFVDAAEIAALNEEHLGMSGPTDVLSFPLDAVDERDAPAGDGSEDGVPRLLGDVIISPAVAAAQYAGHAGTLDDELALLVVHGVLHVLGHDHADPAETELMRRRERMLLEQHHWGHSAPPGFRHDHVEP